MDIITASTISDIEVCRKVDKSDVEIADNGVFCIRYRRRCKAGVEYIHLLATHKPTGDTRTLLMWDYTTFSKQDHRIMALSLNGRLKSITKLIQNKSNEIQ